MLRSEKYKIFVYNKKTVATFRHELRRLEAVQRDSFRRNPRLALAVTAQIDAQKKHAVNGEKFLYDLHYRPTRLLGKALTNLRADMLRFNINYPLRQNVVVRQALARFHLLYAQLKHADLRHDCAQIEFLQFCRLLWLVLKELCPFTDTTSRALSDIVYRHIQDSHIAINTSLPDELACYRLSEESEIMQLSYFLQLELTAYESAKNKLAAFNESLPITCEWQRARRQAVDELLFVLESQQAKPNPDTKCLTTILFQTRLLLKYPQHGRVQNAYACLIDEMMAARNLYACAVMQYILATTLLLLAGAIFYSSSLSAPLLVVLPLALGMTLSALSLFTFATECLRNSKSPNRAAKPMLQLFNTQMPRTPTAELDIPLGLGLLR